MEIVVSLPDDEDKVLMSELKAGEFGWCPIIKCLVFKEYDERGDYVALVASGEPVVDGFMNGCPRLVWRLKPGTSVLLVL